MQYTQEAATTIVTETRDLYVQYGLTGTLLAAQASMTGTVGSGGGMSVVLDVHKSTAGGAFATVLTSTITINASTVIRTIVAAVVNVSLTSLVAGDILRVVCTATAGGGTLPKGIGMNLVIATDPA